MIQIKSLSPLLMWLWNLKRTNSAKNWRRGEERVLNTFYPLQAVKWPKEGPVGRKDSSLSVKLALKVTPSPDGWRTWAGTEGERAPTSDRSSSNPSARARRKGVSSFQELHPTPPVRIDSVRGWAGLCESPRASLHTAGGHRGRTEKPCEQLSVRRSRVTTEWQRGDRDALRLTAVSWSEISELYRYNGPSSPKKEKQNSVTRRPPR